MAQGALHVAFGVAGAAEAEAPPALLLAFLDEVQKLTGVAEAAGAGVKGGRAQGAGLGGGIAAQGQQVLDARLV